jgi:hypothetical protein
MALAVWWLGLAPAVLVGQKGTALPAGTKIGIRLNTQLDTGETQAGQTFTGTVDQPVVAGGRTVWAKGATVKGRVTEVVSSGRLKRPASITLVLTSVPSEPLRIDGKSHLLRNVALIGGAAGAGALIGGATGGKKGAAIGAAIGAGAGTATAYMTGKQEIVLPAELALTFVTAGGVAPATTTVARAEAPRPPPAEAAGPVRGDERGGIRAATEIIFTESDQHAIRNYYSRGSGLPPGLAKRGGKLPPGLEKHLRKNGTLPPGLQKRVQPFPAALTRQLSPLPGGYSRVFLEGRALIVDVNHRILDLMVVIR